MTAQVSRDVMVIRRHFGPCRHAGASEIVKRPVGPSLDPASTQTWMRVPFSCTTGELDIQVNLTKQGQVDSLVVTEGDAAVTVINGQLFIANQPVSP
jgi:hypothetical protein